MYLFIMHIYVFVSLQTKQKIPQPMEICMQVLICLCEIFFLLRFFVEITKYTVLDEQWCVICYPCSITSGAISKAIHSISFEVYIVFYRNIFQRTSMIMPN